MGRIFPGMLKVCKITINFEMSVQRTEFTENEKGNRLYINCLFFPVPRTRAHAFLSRFTLVYYIIDLLEDNG